ncbi:MAG: 4-hydroxythreonine-4-phosphate dehydrogenase PdxA [Candidatus Azobacteroides sp.]|nr:4-hydroxythreonine-4-phosphate dehydrogenase PdxA [Candidatus Azobacteroides sp.]
MEEKKIKIGITQGDINGVGYEVILKILSDPNIVDLCTPIVYGSPKIAAYHRKALNMDTFTFNIISKAEDANAKRINIINCVDEEIRVELGKSTKAAGQASFLALERATEDYKNGLIDALVTAPINKNNIQSEDFQFAGHTDYLQEKFAIQQQALMLMATETLKVGLLSMHVPLSEVPKYVTKENVRKRIQDFEACLKQDFRILKPRIAVLGLNPHAGDNGVIGKEEIEVIQPVIEELQKKSILCYGPYPADGFFGSEKFREFDGILAMYHDQGLIPFKTLAMENGVNYSACLPIIRTSPDHGTAYDIAGQNIASEVSMRQALYMAIDIYRNRKYYEEITANPLRKQYYEKGGADIDISLIENEEKENHGHL